MHLGHPRPEIDGDKVPSTRSFKSVLKIARGPDQFANCLGFAFSTCIRKFLGSVLPGSGQAQHKFEKEKLVEMVLDAWVKLRRG